MEQYRSRLLMMVPKAIRAYEQALDCRRRASKGGGRTKLLEAYQVFRGCIEQARAEPDHRKRCSCSGQMMEMVLYKSGDGAVRHSPAAGP